ncbi:MAG: hypothetical protein RLZZ298_2116 [Pseudomonadota bacterium]|jgi:hypothetical protein
MAENKKTEAKDSAKPVVRSSAPKPPKKLIPRTAPKVVVAQPEAIAEPIAIPAVAAPELVPEGAALPSTKPAAKRVRKVDVELEATNVRNKKAMSDALAKVMAVKIAQPLGRAVPPPDLPKAKKPAKAEKEPKPAKPKKIKLVRDSYAMPENEYEAINALKKRLAVLGNEFKKSELLRGGIATLAVLNDAELLAAMGKVHKIKTGRPAK